ncbi:MAG: hypothetical protein Q8K97_07595 [Pseudohongiella sp.]|nr:hypothetical protein [Pseudohongiella sp.]
MAMIECKECKNQVSSKAATCPHCGTKIGPTAEELQYGIALILVILLFAGFWLFGGSDDEPPAVASNTVAEAPQPPAGWLALDRSDEMQAQRRAFIDQLQAEGILHRVEKPTRYPRIYVGPAWAPLAVDDKRLFLNSVLTYYFAEDPEADAAILRDRLDGRDVGRYSFQYGLELF